MKKILLGIMIFLIAASSASGSPIETSSIPEGSIVKTAGNPDVYVVKYSNGGQYKRLLLNPSVFKSYGHLSWKNLIIISQAKMDSFTTSTLVRRVGSSGVWELKSDNDIGKSYFLYNAEPRTYDSDRVYYVNESEFSNYVYVENWKTMKVSLELRRAQGDEAYYLLKWRMFQIGNDYYNASAQENIDELRFIREILNDVNLYTEYGDPLDFSEVQYLSKLGGVGSLLTI